MVRKVNIKIQSKKYKLNKTDINKILKGAYIAISGAILTYATKVLGQIDFGEYTVIAVAVGGILINAGYKLLKS